jgi:beta-barrel assembly-enhancing protease
MGKLILQFSVLVLIFFAAWFGLSRIDYVKIFRLDNISKKTEKKIGEVIMKTIEKTHETIDDDSSQALIDKIKNRICEGSALNDKDVHVHLIVSSDVNAFALPGNHLIVYTGLIKKCDSVSELCGVMAHEIGHIQLNHVMKRLAGEMGIAVLASVATNGNSQVAAQVIKMLSSTAFERKQESEADAFAVNCLIHAKINPDGFSNFMVKVAKMQSDIPEEMEWISSHPDSKKRAETIRALSKSKVGEYEPALSDDKWADLKSAARSK